MKLLIPGLLIGVSLWATQVPRITVSNRLNSEKDGRIVVSSVIPKPSWATPYKWKVTLDDSVIKTIQGLKVTDTTYRGFPSCSRYRVTVFPANTIKDSLTKSFNLCRSGHPEEIAFLDSYPVAVIRQSKKELKTGDSSFFLCKLVKNKYNNTVKYFDSKCKDLASDYRQEQ